jgi:hypothetical protein
MVFNCYKLFRTLSDTIVLLFVLKEVGTCQVLL